jgi:hypothetical protein
MTPVASPERLLTLSEAARLTGVRKRTLREGIQRGQIAIRVLGKGRDRKLRLTESALVEAGLLGRNRSGDAIPADGNVAALVELLREQNARLAAIEEQRFQFAGQLGAALERVRSLEERVFELAQRVSDASEPEQATHGTTLRPPSLAGTAKAGIGAATVGLAGAVVVRAVAAVSHRQPRRWSASLGSLLGRVRHDGA